MLTLATNIHEFRLSGTPAFLKVHTDQAAQPNIRIDMSVTHFKWDGTIELIGTDSQTPGSDGNCDFEISEYFNAIIKRGFTFPGTNAIKKHEAASGRYTLWCNEYYGNPPIPRHTLMVPEPYYAVKGLIPKWAHNLFYRKYSSFDAKLKAGDTLLSFMHLISVVRNQKYVRLVSKADTLKLFILLTEDTASAIKIKLDFVFTDGTVENNFFLSETLIAKKGQQIEIDAGYNDLGLPGLIPAYFPGKTVASYTVTPYDGETTALLDFQHTFIIDESYSPYRRQFLFRNFAGAFDTIVTTGQASSEVAYEYEVVNTPFWPGAAVANQKNIRTTQEESIKCNTGHVSKDLLAYLPEFFGSEEVYEILDGKLIPIVFNNQTILRSRDKSGLYHVDFDYYHLQSLVPEVVAPATPLQVGDPYEGGIVASVNETTILILALTPTQPLSWNQATAAAAAYQSGVFTDWRLPTRAELLVIRMNIFLSHNETAELENYYHWTSEDDGASAWARSMDPNNELLSNKESAYYYRPVRVKALN